MTKSRTLRKAGAVVLSLAMAFSTVAIAGPDASAAAKKVTLSSKKGTITVNKSKKVTIKGTKKGNIKSVTFKYTNEGIVKATRSGLKITIKGVAAGKTVVKPTIKLKKKVGSKKSFTLKYTATVKDATPDPSATPEAAKSITLVDNDGLQADGTATTSDTLEVSYGVDLGTPKSITWYVDDKVVSTITTQSTGLGIGERQFNSHAVANDVKGVCYTIIENDKGEKWISNKITIAGELAAVMSDVTIENDYDTPKVDFDTKSDEMIATVTLNKNYAGTFYVAAEGTTDFTTAPTNTITTTALRAAANKVSADKFTNKTATANTTTDYACYYDADGKSHYKWRVDDADLNRGGKYVVIFDQTNIDSDDVGKATSKKENLNMTASLEAPYLEAPASIEVSGYLMNTTSTVTSLTFKNAAGSALSWWTEAATISGGTTQIFNTASNAPKETDTAKTIASKKITKGVGELTYNSDNVLFAYAKFVTTAGIFAADSVTLTSKVAESAPKAADSIKLSEDSKDPKSAVVEFVNLRSKATGTLYVLRNMTAADDFGKLVGQDLSSSTVVVGKVPVDPTTITDSKVTITDVFKSEHITGAASYNNQFAALYVPDDLTSYSKVSGGTNASTAFALVAVPTTLALDDTKVNVTTSSGTITVDDATSAVKDQFGNTIPAAGGAIAGGFVGKTYEMVVLKNEGATKTATLAVAAGTADGKAALTLTTYNRAGTAADDTGTTASDGVFYAKVGNTYVVATKTATTKEWKLSTSSTVPTV